jgi:acyl dehydratase
MVDPLQFTWVITPESLARWQVARDDALAPPPEAATLVPMGYFVFLRMQPLLGLSIHDWLGRDPERGLYGGVSYRQTGAVFRVGDTVRADSAVTDRKQVDSPRGVLTVTTLTTIYRCDRGAKLSESVRMIDLPAADAGAATPAEPVASATASVAPPAATPAEGFAPLATLPGLSRRQLAWMTVETGDLNPLHLDAGYAGRRGFADVVAPAPLVTASIERALGRRPTGAQVVPSGLDLRFHAPVHPEQPMALSIREQDDRIEFQAIVDGRLRVEGRLLRAAEAFA